MPSTPTPMPTSTGDCARSRGRGTPVPRSKSQQSEEVTNKVACEARRPEVRPRPSVETRDSYTQTEGLKTADVVDDVEEDDGTPPVMICEAIGGPAGAEFASSSGMLQWLSQPIRMQAELEMALRSNMELIAEHEAMRSRDKPIPPPTLRTTPPLAARRQLGLPTKPLTRPRATKTSGEKAAAIARAVGGRASQSPDGSDDDEVLSLSLSVDGPVIRRSLSEPCEQARNVHAPDPIAMLSDGQRKAMLVLREGLVPMLDVPALEVPTSPPPIGRIAAGGQVLQDGTDSSPRGSNQSVPSSAPDESDNSAAPTQLDIMAPVAEEAALLTSLIPILSKVTGRHALPQQRPQPQKPKPHSSQQSQPPPPQPGQLEVVLEATASPAATSAVVHPVHPVPTTRVRALRYGRTNVQALDLSQLTLRDAPLEDPRPLSARSDVSFGSACSAFSKYSSASGSSSQLASPRGLTGTVSMPSLHQPHAHPQRVANAALAVAAASAR